MRGYRIEGGMNNAVESLGNIPGGIQHQAERLGLNAQVEQRPWLVLGAAVAAGYLLGNLFSDDDDSDRDRDRDYQDRSYNSSAPRTSNQPSQSPNFYTDHPSSAAVSAPAAPASPSSNAGYGGTSNYGAPSSSAGGAASTPPSTVARPASYSVAPSNAPAAASSSGTALASTASSVASSAGSLLSSVVGDPGTIKAQATDMIRSVLRDTIRENIPQMRDQIDELERRNPRQS